MLLAAPPAVEVLLLAAHPVAAVVEGVQSGRQLRVRESERPAV